MRFLLEKYSAYLADLLEKESVNSAIGYNPTIREAQATILRQYEQTTKYLQFKDGLEAYEVDMLSRAIYTVPTDIMEVHDFSAVMKKAAALVEDKPPAPKAPDRPSPEKQDPPEPRNAADKDAKGPTKDGTPEPTNLVRRDVPDEAPVRRKELLTSIYQWTSPVGWIVLFLSTWGFIARDWKKPQGIFWIVCRFSASIAFGVLAYKLSPNYKATADGAISAFWAGGGIAWVVLDAIVKARQEESSK